MKKIFLLTVFLLPLQSFAHLCVTDPLDDGIYKERKLPKYLDITKLCVRRGIKNIVMKLRTLRDLESVGENYYSILFLEDSSEGLKQINANPVTILDPKDNWTALNMMEVSTSSDFKELENKYFYQFNGEDEMDWEWMLDYEMKVKSRYKKKCTQQQIKFKVPKNKFCQGEDYRRKKKCCIKIVATTSESTNDINDDMTKPLKVCFRKR